MFLIIPFLIPFLGANGNIRSTLTCKVGKVFILKAINPSLCASSNGRFIFSKTNSTLFPFVILVSKEWLELVGTKVEISNFEISITSLTTIFCAFAVPLFSNLIK